MNKMNKLTTLTISVFISCALGFSSIVQAQEAEPCGAVLCLSGVSALGGDLGECKAIINLKGLKDVTKF